MQTGYAAEGISGQLCLKKTFLESPFSDPTWFGIYVALLFLIWLIVFALLYKRTKTYLKSLIVLLVPTLGTIIYMAVVSVERNEGLSYLLTKIDWSGLYSAKVWYFAAIQLFFSTNIGFGVFITNASTIYKKANPFWIAACFTASNLLVGLSSVLLFYAFSTQIELQPEDDEIREVQLMAHIYDIGLKMADGYAQPWTIVAFFLMIFSGLISMVTLVYTVLKSFYLEVKRKMAWWQLLLVFSFVIFIIGAALLMCEDYKLVHLLDYYVVGNLVLLSVVIEIFGFVFFYGKLAQLLVKVNN